MSWKTGICPEPLVQPLKKQEAGQNLSYFRLKPKAIQPIWHECAEGFSIENWGRPAPNQWSAYLSLARYVTKPPALAFTGVNNVQRRPVTSVASAARGLPSLPGLFSRPGCGRSSLVPVGTAVSCLSVLWRRHLQFQHPRHRLWRRRC